MSFKRQLRTFTVPKKFDELAAIPNHIAGLVEIMLANAANPWISDQPLRYISRGDTIRLTALGISIVRCRGAADFSSFLLLGNYKSF